MSDQMIGDESDPGADAAGAGVAPNVPVADAAAPVVTGARAGKVPSPSAMTEQAKGVLKESAPWQRGVGWQTLGAEGLVAVVVGIYVIADPDGAQDIVRQLLGALLLINGVLRMLHGFRDNAQGWPATPYRLVSGGIGATVGVIVLAEGFSDYLDENAARWVLGFGFLAFGLIGLCAAFVTRQSGGLRRGPLITGALYTALAVLLFYNLRHETLDPKWFGWAFLIFGAFLLGFAYLLYNRASAGDQAAAAASV